MTCCNITASICPKSFQRNGNVLKTLSLLRIKHQKGISSCCDNKKSNLQNNVMLKHNTAPQPAPHPSFLEWTRNFGDRDDNFYSVSNNNNYKKNSHSVITSRITDDLLCINNLIKDRIKYGSKDKTIKLKNLRRKTSKNIINNHNNNTSKSTDYIELPSKEFFRGEYEYNANKRTNHESKQLEIIDMPEIKEPKREMFFNSKGNNYYYQSPHKGYVRIDSKNLYKLKYDLMDPKILKKPIKRTEFILREMQNVKKKLSDNLETFKNKLNNLRDDSISIYPGKIQKFHLHYNAHPFQAIKPTFKIDAPLLMNRLKPFSKKYLNKNDVALTYFAPRRIRIKRDEINY